MKKNTKATRELIRLSYTLSHLEKVKSPGLGGTSVKGVMRERISISGRGVRPA